jgi:hypothetical protein
MAKVIAQLPRGSLICTVARKSICDGGNCKPAPPSTWAAVNFADDEYASCDKSHCNMEALPKGSLSKGRYATAATDHIADDGWLASFEPNGVFEEIRMSGGTVVSSGTCRRKD